MKYSDEWLKDYMMGPNAIMIVEELIRDVPLSQNMRILDLGCGRGLTSLYVAKEYGAYVFATDLWISASENYEFFKKTGVENQIIPMKCDAMELPFADGYFGAVISVDSYHYFGIQEQYFDTSLSKLLKPDSWVAIAVPGMKYELTECIPEEMKPFWPEDALKTWHSCEWWKKHLEKEKNFELIYIGEMKCFDEVWNSWLKTENPYAIEDIPMMKADQGRYMNLISIIGKKK